MEVVKVVAVVVVVGGGQGIFIEGETSVQLTSLY